MRKNLSQNDIDALFTAAGKGKRASSTQKRKVVPCDLRRASQLNEDQVRVVSTLHESLARRLGNSLGAYLRVGFEMNLVSAEQLTYAQFLGRITELTYFASLRVLPIDARAALQADLSLVYPIVDLVLGGNGSGTIETRDLTEIEEQIFETVVRLVAKDLQITWAPVLELDFQFDQRQQHAQIHGLMLPVEKVLSLNFEIRLPDAKGMLGIAFPAVVANALLRKLSMQWSYSERTPSRDARQRLRNRLLGSHFVADLSLPPCPLTIRNLLALEPGHVLTLPKRANEPIHVNVAGKPMFLALPVRHGNQRGARIEQRLSLASNEARENK